MRIAIIAPIVLPIPVKKYGGTERVIYSLTEELVRRKHEVTLFASGDSITSAKLVSVYHQNLIDAGFVDPYGFNDWSALNIGLAYSMQDQFDIIHDHNYTLSLSTANLAKTPVVLTLHGPITPNNKKLFETLNKPYIVTISNNQALPSVKINHVGTVYHGIDVNSYPFSSEPDNYLLFVGRISHEKGVHFAIEVAKYLDIPLIMAAKVDSVDIPYFEEKIKPHLSEKIRWVGEVGPDERNRLMSKALAFLHPVSWREPFGLTLIEAMACGCPVVAFRRGSIPEIVKHEKTGFVVEDVAEMIDAITRIKKIDRAYTRKYTLETFTIEKMVDRYEAIYNKILALNTTKLLKPLTAKTIGNGHGVLQKSSLYAD